MASFNDTIELSEDDDDKVDEEMKSFGGPSKKMTNAGPTIISVSMGTQLKTKLNVNGNGKRINDIKGEREKKREAKKKDDVDTCSVLFQLGYHSIKVDRILVEKFLEILKDLDDRVQRTVQLLQACNAFEGNDEIQTNFDGKQTPNDEAVKEEEQEEAELECWDEEMEEVQLPISVQIHRGLLQDVEKVLDVFPNADRRELYAYLEAHRDRDDRVAVVIEELLTGQAPTVDCNVNNGCNGNAARDMALDVSALFQKRKEVPSGNLVVTKKVRFDNDLNEQPGTSKEAPKTDSDAGAAAIVEVSFSNETADIKPERMETDAMIFLESQLTILKDMFPDADPDYLLEFLTFCGGNEERLKEGVINMLERRDYPRLKDSLERKRKEQMKSVYTTRHFTPEEILQWGFDPLSVFYDTEKHVGVKYRELTTRQLQNMFPHLRALHLKKVLCNNKYHFLPCLRELEKLDWKNRAPGPFYKRQATPFVELRTEPDEQFYKEVAFARVEQEFREYVNMNKKIRETKVETARSAGILLTCNCCFDDELIAEDTVECLNEHTFCMACVRKGMEVAIGQGKTSLDCMMYDCKKEFSLETLRLVLSPNVFSNLLKKIQAAEIELAGIPDLEMCSFCSFAAIMPNHEDKVFRCLNPDCLKETCRICKEPSHIPLKCNEVEKSSEVKMRTFIENKMSEALMRECPKCKKHFTKSEGCNMMTCICGAKMCYVCRQPIKDYNHFGPQKCPQMSNTDMLHVDEVYRGAEQARRQFESENPDMVGMDLKYDPTKGIAPAPVAPHASFNVHDVGGLQPRRPINMNEFRLLLTESHHLDMHNRLEYIVSTARFRLEQHRAHTEHPMLPLPPPYPHPPLNTNQ